MNKLRISMTEKNGATKGSISISGSTGFTQACMADVVRQIAKCHNVTTDRVLQDIAHVIATEDAA